MQTTTQSSIDFPGIKKLRSGKVREVFDLGDTLLFVVTDRISAFDVILPDPIPQKGAVLNQISAFWFKRFETIQNHLVTANFEEFSKELQPFREQLAGRSMIVKKTKPLPVECVVRGYLAGSGWKGYQESLNACGIELPAGLASINNSCAIIWRRLTGTRLHLRRVCRKMLLRKRRRNTWRLSIA